MSFMDAREHGSKPGSAGPASSQHEAVDRRERLRRLALETIDLGKDPYFMRNHLGSYECKLCLTIHGNEGNYLAHTQGKRHQQNLAKRAAREASENPALPAANSKRTRAAPRKTVKIGRPGYRVTKQYDAATRQRSLLFQVDYPEIEEGTTPRHRFMSSYEQKVEAWDKKYQYLMFAAEPYEVVAFKVPNLEVDKARERFFTHWEPDKKVFTVQMYFKNGYGGGGRGGWRWSRRGGRRWQRGWRRHGQRRRRRRVRQRQRQWWVRQRQRQRRRRTSRGWFGIDAHAPPANVDGDHAPPADVDGERGHAPAADDGDAGHAAAAAAAGSAPWRLRAAPWSVRTRAWGFRAAPRSLRSPARSLCAPAAAQMKERRRVSLEGREPNVFYICRGG